MAPERLQKVIAASGVASRRQAEVLIANGRVTVDGKIASIGAQVDGAKAIIAVDGRVIGATTQKTYLLLHKPAGVTSTVRDRHATQTVLDYLPTALVPEGARLYPVGRLDLDSEGLLVLTNDGEWSERVLHPRYGVEREYAIGLRGRLDGEQVEALKAGIEVDEGLATLGGLRSMTGTEVERLAELLRPPPDDITWYRATLAQGWKRQLRRMFGAVGAPIERLVRVRIGPVRIDGLGDRPGETAQGPRGPWPGLRRRLVSRPPEGPAGMSRKLVVALDGPGSSGKSSVGAAAALACGYRFCDTGLLYRAVDLARARP